jgi:hypothetical protein
MIGSMTRPNGNLVCPPACFDVDDRKNPFMTMQTPVDIGGGASGIAVDP